MSRVKKSSAPADTLGTTGGAVPASADSAVPEGRTALAVSAPPAHIHEPVPHAPYIVYVPVQRQRFYTCATCGIPLFVIPTPEEADEFDRVLSDQLEESTWPSR